jgi:hypothetical protein
LKLPRFPSTILTEDAIGKQKLPSLETGDALLSIEAGDIVSDRGTEIYNVIAARRIDTVLIMGVHANMCILNRSFGIKQLARWSVPCILVRDLTDAMYNPKSRPYVSHAAGTDLCSATYRKILGSDDHQR